MLHSHAGGRRSHIACGASTGNRPSGARVALEPAEQRLQEGSGSSIRKKWLQSWNITVSEPGTPPSHPVAVGEQIGSRPQPHTSVGQRLDATRSTVPCSRHARYRLT